MGRLTVVGLLGGLLCFMSPAAFSEGGGFYGEIGPAYSYSLDTVDDLGSAFGADVKAGYLFLDWLGVDLDLSYLTGFEEVANRASESLDVLTVLVDVRFAPNVGLEKVRPYGYVGAGGIFEFWDRSWPGGQESETVTNPAVQVGVGVDFLITDRIYLAPEVRYLNDFDEVSYIGVLGVVGIRL